MEGGVPLLWAGPSARQLLVGRLQRCMLSVAARLTLIEPLLLSFRRARASLAGAGLASVRLGWLALGLHFGAAFRFRRQLSSAALA